MTDLPTLFSNFDPVLSVREKNRLQRHGACYETLMANIAKRNNEREVQMFLLNEVEARAPRQTVVSRLCGKLLRMQARRKRNELELYVRSPRA